VFIVIVWFGLSACEKKYVAPVPNTAWSAFDSPKATTVTSVPRRSMEGVYRVTAAAGQFGEQVAMKWSFVTSVKDTTYYLSVFGEKDIAYFICEGKRYQNSLILNGYWRKMTNVETGIARFIISGENGANQLFSGSPNIGTGDIILKGTWGNGDELPTDSVIFSYERPLYKDKPLEIVGHRAGGRTSDHLPVAENSIGMIKFASRQGATGIEIDIRLTSDGIPVLYHDNTLNLRLIQKNGLVGRIEDYSFQQINTFVRLIDGESIPTLRDALDAVVYNTDIRFVWLDTRYIGSLGTVRELQKEYLEKAKDIGREVQIVIGLPGEDQVNAFLALPDYQSAPAVCELSLDDVHKTQAVGWGPRWTLGIQSAEVAQAQSEGRKAYVWTLDDPTYVDQFVNQGNFDGILSNYPSLVAYYHYVKQ
jgi:glycerophosphoryl diester phosphodiesterase